MSYRIRGLSATPFLPYFGRPDEELAAHNMRRYVVTEQPGFPCRIGLDDAAIGETILLINHVYQPADSPYRGSHAIFVRESSRPPAEYVDTIPPAFAPRLLSIRAFDAADMMTDAEVVDGANADAAIRELLARDEARYLHVHTAKRGCFLARVDRA